MQLLWLTQLREITMYMQPQCFLYKCLFIWSRDVGARAVGRFVADG